MDFFHCNACYSHPSATRPLSYYFTSCCHIFCGNCGDMSASQCKVCGKSCSIQLLTGQSQTAKWLVSNGTQTSKNILRALLMQNSHYNLFFQERLKPLEANYTTCRRKLEQTANFVHKLERIYQNLNAEYEKLLKEYEALSRPIYGTNLNQDLASDNFYSKLTFTHNSEDSGHGESVGMSSASFRTPRCSSPPRQSASYSSKTFAGMPTIQTFVMSSKPLKSVERPHSSSSSSRNSTVRPVPRRGRKSGFFPLPNNPK